MMDAMMKPLREAMANLLEALGPMFTHGGSWRYGTHAEARGIEDACERARSAIAAAIASAEQGRTERRVPVQGERLYRREFPAGTVAWSEHLEAWQWYAKAGHGDQSAERVVERGGFGWTELCCLLGRTPQTWRAR